MKLNNILQSKILVFCCQFIILSLILFIFQYHYPIAFDINTSFIHRQIIQFLANYVLFDKILDFFLILISWILISLLPIFFFKNIRKVYSLNLLAFFLPNFFFYVFLQRYSESYFDAEFPNLVIRSILLGIIIIAISILFSLLFDHFIQRGLTKKTEDLKALQKQTTITCPNCGTHFNSIPKYCYKCNTVLTPKSTDLKNHEE